MPVNSGSMSPSTPTQLPILSATPSHWADLVRRDLPRFLGDHAVCEQQAAQNALSLVGHYPDDAELVERMTALAAEEIQHLRRVLAILRRRGWSLSRMRSNPWVKALRGRIEPADPTALKVDRLLVATLIEARSCERFACAASAVAAVDPEIAGLLEELGPAEERHWRLFHDLAARAMPAAPFAERWQRWLAIERDVSAGYGVAPTVHG